MGSYGRRPVSPAPVRAVRAGYNSTKTCDQVLEDNAINEADKDKCKHAKEERDKASALAAAAKTKREHYNTLKATADGLGSIATSASGSAHFSPEKSQPIQSQNMEKIADAVARIVESTFRFDELRMTCVLELRKKESRDSDLYKKCLDLLQNVVASDIAVASEDLTAIVKRTIEQEKADVKVVLQCAYENDKPTKLTNIVTKAQELSEAQGRPYDSYFRELENYKAQDASRTVVNTYLHDKGPSFISLLRRAAETVCPTTQQ